MKHFYAITEEKIKLLDEFLQQFKLAKKTLFTDIWIRKNYSSIQRHLHMEPVELHFKAEIPENVEYVTETIDDNSAMTNVIEETKSYAEVVGGNTHDHSNGACGGRSILCPYEFGCPYRDTCTFEHGEMCELCLRICLHPKDKEQRKKHISECIQQHERNMELSFAIARSKDKTCGICFNKIVEKAGHEQRFGILPNCNHVFCLRCIRKWRINWLRITRLSVLQAFFSRKVL